MQAYENAAHAIRQAGGDFVAVSPMTVSKSLAFSEKLGLSYSVLSDAGNTYARTLDLVFRVDDPVQAIYRTKGLDLPACNGDDSWTLPVTAVFGIGPEHTLFYRWAEGDYSRRPEPDVLLEALKNNA